MNVLMLEGRLTRDAETRFTQAGKAVAGFTVATDVGFGENKKTLFIDCSLWGKRAEGGLIQYLTKGTAVVVHGELQPNDWTDRDGNQRKGVKLNLADVKLMGGKQDQSSGSSQQSGFPSHGGGGRQAEGDPNAMGGRNDPFASAPDFGDVPDDDSIPF